MHPVAKPGMPGKEKLERAAGIEAAWKAWKASALPLNYARILSALNDCVRL
jgi:hypothetical protein